MRLDAFVRRIEQHRRPEADVRATIDHERAISRSLGGRTVLDDVKQRRDGKRKRGQLELFDDRVTKSGYGG
jgi:hypothetical protein